MHTLDSATRFYMAARLSYQYAHKLNFIFVRRMRMGGYVLEHGICMCVCAVL